MISLIPIRWSLLFLLDPLYWWVIFFNRDSRYYELDTWSEDIFVSPRSTSLSWSTARTKREVGRCPTWLRRMLKGETLLCLFRAKKISSIWALMVSDESFQSFKPGLHWGWWLRCWAYSGCEQHLPGICQPPGNSLFLSNTWKGWPGSGRSQKSWVPVSWSLSPQLQRWWHWCASGQWGWQPTKSKIKVFLRPS